MIIEKIQLVNKPEFLEEKQAKLNQIALAKGTEPKIARIDEKEYLKIMDE